MKFELDRLIDYDDAEVLAELRRVAAIAPEGPLSRRIFEQHSRVSAKTVRRRFGSWEAALQHAQLQGRYSGAVITEKQMTSVAKQMTDAELIDELRLVASKLGRDVVTTREVDEHSRVGSAIFRRRFGSWKSAIQSAGLSVARSGQRFTNDELFENLLAVWTHYGRAPTYDEMREMPSRVTADTYKERFKTWNRALAAFVERANAEPEPSPTVETTVQLQRIERAAEDVRKIGLGLRFRVLHRDRFHCVLCGDHPARNVECILHVDHVVPWSSGGKTREDNLRTLCATCNIGRGNRFAD
jgi:hypothetical protein